MKIGVVITARLKSSRLPRKVLREICGKPMLERVVERANAVSAADQVVVASSWLPQDRPIEELSRRLNVGFFPGDPDDVLSRILSVAKFYELDYVVSITADNPLFSPLVGDIALDLVRESEVPIDFVFARGLPVGIAPSILRVAALDVASRFKSEIDTEIWGPFVNHDEFFSIVDVEYSGYPVDESVRITCDFEEDMELVSRLIESTAAPVTGPDLPGIARIHRESPGIFEINANRKQIYPSESRIRAIRRKMETNAAAILHYRNEKGLPWAIGRKVHTISAFSAL